VLDAGDAQGRPVVAQKLEHWQADPNLAGVRDRDALAKLPADERRAWEALWENVDALLKAAARPGPTASTPGGATPDRQGGAPAESRPSAPPRASVAPATPRPDDAEALEQIHKRSPRAGTFQARRSRAAVPPGARGLPQGGETGRDLEKHSPTNSLRAMAMFPPRGHDPYLAGGASGCRPEIERARAAGFHVTSAGLVCGQRRRAIRSRTGLGQFAAVPLRPHCLVTFEAGARQLC
jgi:hypothetical protein